MLSSLFQMIAPHHCAICNGTGALLCQKCAKLHIKRAHSTCYRCNRITDAFRTCRACRSSSQVFALFKLSLYEDPVKKLIYQTKFDGARAGAKELGVHIASALPCYEYNLVSYVPTDASRVRYRGFDHAEQMAQEVAVRTGRPMLALLYRRSGARQLGASREKRKSQMSHVLAVKNRASIQGASILLIDDVVSTAASIEASALLLKNAGARRVTVAVAAHNR